MESGSPHVCHRGGAVGKGEGPRPQLEKAFLTLRPKRPRSRSPPALRSRVARGGSRSPPAPPARGFLPLAPLGQEITGHFAVVQRVIDHRRPERRAADGGGGCARSTCGRRAGARGKSRVVGRGRFVLRATCARRAVTRSGSTSGVAGARPPPRCCHAAGATGGRSRERPSLSLRLLLAVPAPPRANWRLTPPGYTPLRRIRAPPTLGTSARRSVGRAWRHVHGGGGFTRRRASLRMARSIGRRSAAPSFGGASPPRPARAWRPANPRGASRRHGPPSAAHVRRHPTARGHLRRAPRRAHGPRARGRLPSVLPATSAGHPPE